MKRIFVFMLSPVGQGNPVKLPYSLLNQWQHLAAMLARINKKLGLILMLNAGCLVSLAQDTAINPARDTAGHSINNKRVWLVTAANVVGYGGSLIILNNAWYKNYAHSSFHTFDDSREWLQVDKIGHGWTAYNTSKVSYGLWKWAGLSEKKSALLGGITGATYLTVIEFLDAHSSKWGWSWSDIAANLGGSGLFVAQQLTWQEQRIQFKFSFHRKNYNDPVLEERADDLFGKTWYERMLKDYNGQTFWLSANIKSFFKQSDLPAWLNISFGYGAEGMFGGFENKWTDGDPGFPVNRTDIPRKRQFYISPDIDFTKIRTDKKWLKSAFFFLNAFKFPAPGIEFSGKTRLRALVF